MPGRSLVDEVTAAIADDDPVDWTRVEAEGDEPESRQLAALKGLAAWRAARGTSDPAALDTRLDPLARIVAVIAALKIVAAAAGLLIAGAPDSAIPAWWQFGMVTAFTAGACWLWVGGASDVRSRHLAIVFLLTASAYGWRFGDALSGLIPSAVQPWWRGLAPEAFMPYAAWHFARRFPRSLRLSLADLLTTRGIDIARVLGLGLAAATLTATVLGPGSAVARWLAPIARLGTDDLGFWALAGVPAVGAFAASLVRTRHATAAERQRVVLFFGAFVVATAPLFVEICAELLSPALRQYMAGPAQRRALAGATYLTIGTIPWVTAYSVTVHRLLSVSVIVRRALQWALARWLLTTLTVAPLAAMVWYAAGHRELTIAALVESTAARWLLACACAGIALLLLRDRLVARVDAAFDTPDHELQHAFTVLTSELRTARDERDAITMVEHGVARALGAPSARVFVADGPQRAFVAARGPAPPLTADAAIPWLLEGQDAAIDISSSGRLRSRRLLPAADREWAEAIAAEVAAPIRSSGGELSGLLVVGTRPSGFDFTDGERVFLAGVAHALALTARAPQADAAGGDPAPAAECERCGRVWPSEARTCECGLPLASAAVPEVLAGKFRIERVAGRGGMGIVYRAVDTTLDRVVAVKTLPRLSTEADRRLRDEARVMASVPHPHVAAIHGIETWRGATMLIVEFLEGGTLAARLAGGPLSWADIARTGLHVADGLAALHAAAILHRDVKPSNIGFTAEGQVKLLDFGVASTRSSGEDPATERRNETGAPEASYLAGTPLYLSPEVAAGALPAATDDLWALAMVLYEALAGAHPFAGHPIPGVLELARRARVPRLTPGPRLSAIACGFLAEVLHPSLAHRPQTAAAFRERLAQTQ